MIAIAFALLGLATFTLLIAAEEYRRLTARLRREFEEAFGHAHRIYPPAAPHTPAPGKFGRGISHQKLK